MDELTIYAIYTQDENGKDNGVYVGSTYHGVETRISAHLSDKSKAQKELHDIMRKGMFRYEILRTVKDSADRSAEYDCLNRAKSSGLRIYNKVFGASVSEPIDRNSIGFRINQHLKRNGLKSHYVAARAGISDPVFNAIIHNRRNIGAMEYYHICKALDVPFEKFIEEAEG